MGMLPKSATLTVFQIHKLWPENCLDGDKSGVCRMCNTDARASLFREALADAAACAAKKATKGRSLQVMSTVGLTNTSFARDDGDDAVHYKQATTQMEGWVLLNTICGTGSRGPGSAFEGQTLGKCQFQDYDARIPKEERGACSGSRRAKSAWRSEAAYANATRTYFGGRRA